jgi:hypothetical protein
MDLPVSHLCMQDRVSTWRQELARAEDVSGGPNAALGKRMPLNQNREPVCSITYTMCCPYLCTQDHVSAWRQELAEAEGVSGDLSRQVGVLALRLERLLKQHPHVPVRALDDHHHFGSISTDRYSGQGGQQIGALAASRCFHQLPSASGYVNERSHSSQRGLLLPVVEMDSGLLSSGEVWSVPSVHTYRPKSRNLLPEVDVNLLAAHHAALSGERYLQRKLNLSLSGEGATWRQLSSAHR